MKKAVEIVEILNYDLEKLSNANSSLEARCLQGIRIENDWIEAVKTTTLYIFVANYGCI